MINHDKQPIAEFHYQAKSFPRAAGCLFYSIFFISCTLLLLAGIGKLVSSRITWGYPFCLFFLAVGVVGFSKIIGGYAIRSIKIYPDRIVTHGFFRETTILFVEALLWYGYSPTSYQCGNAMTFITGRQPTDRLKSVVFGKNITIQMDLLSEEDQKQFFNILSNISKRPEYELRNTTRGTPFYTNKLDEKM